MKKPEPCSALRLDNQLCFALHSTSLLMTKAYKPLLQGIGLTYPQYLAMLVLWEWQAEPPEQPSVKALGERLMLDSGTLTPLLKRLEQLGLVQRRRAQHDEREVHLGLTAEGAALREKVLPLREELLCRSGIDLSVTDGLREQLDGLLRQLTQLDA